MLHFISWHSFIVAISELTVIYYLIIAAIFLRTRIRKYLKGLPMIASFLLTGTALRAQTADGNNGINQANSMVRSYFPTAVQLLYALSGLVALIGAFRVFQLLTSDHRGEAQRAAVAWFGACVFIVIVATVIQAFFGI